ncbi:hypothetical protein MKK65_01790 [Methylobacterium sp. J-001]|uniref:hypothetical protein n=1 Tax=Methylobacterium sp. J-001 TaxID=2836609 RepID=UPI001FB8A96C|nr:hypothetical protein [Methylobacterium sp. J-001]MCJ2115335.1 hypothetical protein [Methylobacterium sp. J-001]
MRAPLKIATLVVLALGTQPGWGQSVSQTGTGGGPATAAKAPHTTATGQTVPNPRALGPNETGSIDRRSPAEQRNDAITRGICVGCAHP